MARSVHKGPFVDRHLLKKVEEIIKSGKKSVVRTWSRRSTILPQMVGITFGVHNGNKFIPVLVTDNLLLAQPGNASRTAGSTGSPRICAIAPASAAPPATTFA